jgi:hypothetical protein
MKIVGKKIIVISLATAAFFAHAAQEPKKVLRGERLPALVHDDSRQDAHDDSQPVYLTVGALQDFQAEMRQSILGDLELEHEHESKAQEELNQARLDALRERLKAEGKSEQEIFALLKIEQDKFDAEMKELICKQGEAQQAKMAEFLANGLGYGQDRDWSPQSSVRSGRLVYSSSENEDGGDHEGEEDWDAHFLAASLVHTGNPNTDNAHTKQAGDL